MPNIKGIALSILIIIFILIMVFLQGFANNQSIIAKVKRIEIYPANVTIFVDDSQSFTVEGFNKKGNSLGDITDWVKFDIDYDAGGCWDGNTYQSKNPGQWIVSAKLGICRAEALLLVKPEELPDIPAKIKGSLYRTFGPIGQYEDVSAFVYDLGYQPMVHISSSVSAKDYILPKSDGIIQFWVKTILTSKDRLFIAYGVPIVIDEYLIAEDSLNLISSITIGDKNSRLWGFIRLNSGKLFVAWYQHVSGLDGINVGFAYIDSSGNWQYIPYTWLSPNHWPTHATICQHPADNSIWWFSISDGNSTIKVIHLIENGDNISVDWVNQNFISSDDGDEMQPEGEIPFLIAEPDISSNSIILAYQNKEYKFFSTGPIFCKGSKMVVVMVGSEGNKNLVFVLDKWLEVMNQFCLGIINSEMWLAYGKIDEENFTWNDLYFYKDGKEVYLGKLEGGISLNTGIKICNSSKLIIANMNDGYIHFYPVAK